MGAMKLTDDQVYEIHMSKLPARVLAERYNVVLTTIKRIRDGEYSRLEKVLANRAQRPNTTSDRHYKPFSDGTYER